MKDFQTAARAPWRPLHGVMIGMGLSLIPTVERWLRGHVASRGDEVVKIIVGLLAGALIGYIVVEIRNRRR